MARYGRDTSPSPLETEVFLGSLSLSLIPLIIPDSLLLSITAVDSWPDEDKGSIHELC